MSFALLEQKYTSGKYWKTHRYEAMYGGFIPILGWGIIIGIWLLNRRPTLIFKWNNPYDGDLQLKSWLKK